MACQPHRRFRAPIAAHANRTTIKHLFYALFMLKRTAKTKHDACATRFMHTGRRRGEQGVVIFIVLIGMLLMVAMLSYVFNAGEQVKQRSVTQDAADAGVAAGAGWIARSFNMIANNNVEVSRLIASGSINRQYARSPSNTHSQTYKTANSLHLPRNSPEFQNNLPQLADESLASVLNRYYSELEEQQIHLEEMHQFFEGYDVQNMTLYPVGNLWKAMEALKDFNYATVQTLGEAAQLNTTRGAEINLNLGPKRPGQQFPCAISSGFPYRNEHFRRLPRPMYQWSFAIRQSTASPR